MFMVSTSDSGDSLVSTGQSDSQLLQEICNQLFKRLLSNHQEFFSLGEKLLGYPAKGLTITVASPLPNSQKHKQTYLRYAALPVNPAEWSSKRVQAVMFCLGF
jgi:hypothetical protein